MRIVCLLGIIYVLIAFGCGMWDEEFNSDEGYPSVWVDIESKLNSLNLEKDESSTNIYSMDPLLQDDYEDFELSDVIALSESKLDYDIDIYTPEQKQEFMDHHNIYRANMTGAIPKASDMNFMEYSPILEWQASEWVKECKWQHGFAASNNLTPMIGQNMYKGESRSPSRAMWMWYEEYKIYSFHNMSCEEPYPEYKCGHFTQMLWGDTKEIGCARRSYCFPLAKKHILVSCHYYVAGNWIILGFPIFRVGQPCTRCKSSDGNLCHKNLCVEKRMCEKYNIDCSCKASCKNCVRPNVATCRCEPCKCGWDWEDCSYPCKNEADALSKDLCPLLIKSNATCNEYVPGRWCRKLCGFCASVEPKLSDNLCCNGKSCKQYYVLDEKTCECVLDCPSPLCLYTLNVNTSIPTMTSITKITTKHGKSLIRVKENINIKNETVLRRNPAVYGGAHVMAPGSLAITFLFIRIFI